MTAARYHTSQPTERAFMTRKSWQHPGRRHHVHGPIKPADNLARMGRRIPSARIAVAGALIIAGFFALQLARPLLGLAASDAHQAPRASGPTASSLEAGGR